MGSRLYSVPGQLRVAPSSVTLSKLHIFPKLPPYLSLKYEEVPTSEHCFEGYVIIRGTQRMPISGNSLHFKERWLLGLFEIYCPE